MIMFLLLDLIPPPVILGTPLEVLDTPLDLEGLGTPLEVLGTPLDLVEVLGTPLEVYTNMMSCTHLLSHFVRQQTR